LGEFGPLRIICYALVEIDFAEVLRRLAKKSMNEEQRKIFPRIFSPRNLAIVGVSQTYSGVGGEFFLRNLQRAGYSRRIYLINQTQLNIKGLSAFPNISSLPEVVDLAIICVPAQSVPHVLEECGDKGIQNIHILSSGFKELGTPEGIRLEGEVRHVAERYRLNIIGPNCLGPYAPASRLMPWGQMPGSLAFLSQSGTLAQRMSEHAHFMGIGLSKAVSFGNATVLDSTDFLEYLAEDEETKVIGLYLESVQDGRRFLEIARRLNRSKPLIIWKGGETPSVAGVAVSHTGPLSREGQIWDGAMRQAGITRVQSLEEIAGTAMAFLTFPPVRGRRIFILGGGGGNNVYNADICERLGLQVPALKGESREKLEALIPGMGSSASNPFYASTAFHDTLLMAKILDLAFKDPALDLIIVNHPIYRLACTQAEKRGISEAVIDYLRKNRFRKPLVTVLDSSGEDPLLASEATSLRQRLCQAGIPAYASVPLAAQALASLAAYSERMAE
jgi:acyl-CoA synthetase (NDP forming)